MKIRIYFFKVLTSLAKKLNIKILKIPMVIKGIGHQIIEPVTLVKQKKLGLNPYKWVLFFSLDMHYSKQSIPYINDRLIKYLKPYFLTIVYEYHEKRWERIKFKVLLPLLYTKEKGSKFNIYSCPNYELEIDSSNIMSRLQERANMFEVAAAYPKHLFKIKANDLKYGERVFEKLKIPKGAWFVTFHVRTKKFYSGIDYENEYDNRCADIDSYYLALKYIVDQGGYCVCIAGTADTFSKKIKGLGEKVININLEDCCEKKISPFLFSQCKFFLGCNSGPSIIAGNFGVPTVQVQTSPFWGIPIHTFDLFIFKKLWSKKENRFLNFEEMFQKPLTYTNLDSQFRELGVDVVDNTPEEVLDAVIEMNESLDGKSEVNPEVNEKQKKFRDYFNPSMYSYKAKAKVGSQFLLSNNFLFEKFNTVSEKEASFFAKR